MLFKKHYKPETDMRKSLCIEDKNCCKLKELVCDVDIHLGVKTNKNPAIYAFQKLHSPLQFRSHLMDLKIMPKEEVNQITFLYDNLIYQRIKNRY